MSNTGLRVEVAREETLSAQDISFLSEFEDSRGHAVSFYFRPSSGAAGERDAMLINLRVHDIITNDFGRGHRNHGLLRDLDAVLEKAEGASDSGPLKVIFACHDRGIWREFEVPASGRMVRLEAGKRFDLGPLLRVMDFNRDADHATAAVTRPI